MPRRITAININDDHLVAVQVKCGLNRYDVTQCYRLALTGTDLKDGVRGLSEAVDLTNQTCVVSIPPHQVSFRNVEMPFKDAKKIRQTLPYEMETRLPLPVEDLIIDYVETSGSGSGEILSAALEKLLMSGYLESLQAQGLDPDRLDISGLSIVGWLQKQNRTPDHYLLLEMGQNRATLFFSTGRRVALIRTLDLTAGSAGGDQETDAYATILGHQLRYTIHAYASTHERFDPPEKIFFTADPPIDSDTERRLGDALNVAVERIDISGDNRVSIPDPVARDWFPGAMNSALAAAIENRRDTPHIDFRQHEFEKKGARPAARRTIKKLTVFSILILALLSGNMLYDYYFLKNEYKRLDTQIRQLFKKTLPQVTRIVNPVQQLKVEIRQLERTSASSSAGAPDRSVLTLLKDISGRIPETLDVYVSRMVMDPETVRMSGKTGTFNAVDSLKNALTPSAYFSKVTISSANLDREDNRVKFEMKLKRNL